jgi:hypothetical protein
LLQPGSLLADRLLVTLAAAFFVPFAEPALLALGVTARLRLRDDRFGPGPGLVDDPPGLGPGFVQQALRLQLEVAQVLEAAHDDAMRIGVLDEPHGPGSTCAILRGRESRE